ncbi:Hypothetical predicted protein [Paramuricea clavata]|uniref:CABIT domain-containing protein n=1 Tax=Paramuricea clavata TaxID=317549 RepID=A0A7D9EA19_PARCT|nr:Hypothetical predicted protein [Paramuricea clavata]
MAIVCFENSVRSYYDASKDEQILNVGDILHLKSINKTKKGGKKLVCINQNGHTIELPKDCVAGGFQPTADGKEYYLAEVLKKFSLPLYVRFVEPYTMDQETRSKDKPLYQPAEKAQIMSTILTVLTRK